MADKRMFSSKILGSTQYIEMPPQSQALYIQLCMSADDDGFVNNMKLIQKMIGFQPKFGKVLIQNGYILEINRDLHVITHWWIHNKRDRNNQKPTIYQEALQILDLGDDKVYRINSENQSEISLKSVGNQSVRKDKIREDKIKEKNKSVCNESDCEHYDFYISNFINPLLEKVPTEKLDIDKSYSLWLERSKEIDTDIETSSNIVGHGIWQYYHDFNGDSKYMYKLSSLLGEKWGDNVKNYVLKYLAKQTKQEEEVMDLWQE